MSQTTRISAPRPISDPRVDLGRPAGEFVLSLLLPAWDDTLTAQPDAFVGNRFKMQGARHPGTAAASHTRHASLLL